MSTPQSSAAQPTAAASISTRSTHPRWVEQGCKLTEAEYGTLSALKKRASVLARPMKRSELLRVGLHALAQLDDLALMDVLDRITVVRR